MKARKKPLDYQEIHAKVAKAAELMAEGLSEAKAAKEVGLPRSSLQQYIKHGVPKSGLPKEKGGCQGDLAGENRDASKLPAQESQPSQRDDFGKFLPGNSAGSLIEKPTRQARVKFEAATPEVAKKLIRIFDALPDDNPEMVLAFAKEILDRGLGKPTQTLDITETSLEQHEYKFIQEIILHDEEALRLAVAFSQCLEGHARHNGPEAEPGQMAALPAPK
jgi:hypothetical protein